MGKIDCRIENREFLEVSSESSSNRMDLSKVYSRRNLQFDCQEKEANLQGILCLTGRRNIEAFSPIVMRFPRGTRPSCDKF